MNQKYNQVYPNGIILDSDSVLAMGFPSKDISKLLLNHNLVVLLSERNCLNPEVLGECAVLISMP
jgi:hypothetical protein